MILTSIGPSNYIQIHNEEKNFEAIRQTFKEAVDADASIVDRQKQIMLSEIGVAENLSQLLNEIGIEIKSKSVLDNDFKYGVAVNTTLKDVVEQILLTLGEKKMVTKYDLTCWSGEYADSVYEIFTSVNDGKWQKKPLLLSVMYVDGGRSWYYSVDGKIIESAQENVYIGLESNEREIVENIDSRWDDSTYSIGYNYYLGIYTCEESIPVYDGVQVTVCGYGDSPEAALQNVKLRVSYMRNIAMEKYGYIPARDVG